jgi:glutathione peroxidase-family protein
MLMFLLLGGLAVADAGAPVYKFKMNTIEGDATTLRAYKGKVLLVVNVASACGFTPQYTALEAVYEKYKDKGLVIVGVHTPEFPFEKSLSNVQAALKRHGIQYPVAQDNDSTTWDAYRNRYWPAQYIVDQSGKIVYSHAGEGAYDEIEKTIQSLLKVSS